jgi:hypothetical protein
MTQYSDEERTHVEEAYQMLAEMQKEILQFFDEEGYDEHLKIGFLMDVLVNATMSFAVNNLADDRETVLKACGAIYDMHEADANNYMKN